MLDQAKRTPGADRAFWAVRGQRASMVLLCQTSNVVDLTVGTAGLMPPSVECALAGIRNAIVGTAAPRSDGRYNCRYNCWEVDKKVQEWPLLTK